MGAGSSTGNAADASKSETNNKASSQGEPTKVEENAAPAPPNSQAGAQFTSTVDSSINLNATQQDSEGGLTTAAMLDVQPGAQGPKVQLVDTPQDEQVKEIVLQPGDTAVDLTHTRQTTVPDGLDQLKNLKQLTLRWNLFKSIEGDKLRCFANTLTYLDMYDNQITTMDGLQKLVNLEYLDLSFNRLTKIECLENLTKLKTLYLVHNGIRKIQNLENNTQLELLELGDNKIAKIENIRHLVNLKKLFLGANRIVTIENLDTLVNLKVLSLPANRIDTLGGFEKLVELRELYLSQNGILVIGDTLKAQTILEILDLNYNRLKNVTSAEIGHMMELTDLWLQQNELENLHAHLAAFAKLPALRTLYMMSNPCTRNDTDDKVELEYRRRALMALPQITRLDFQPCRQQPLTVGGAHAKK